MNQQFLEMLSIFVFMYPAGMAIYWVTASLCYYLFMEGKLGQPTFQQMPKERVPMVSIMVPCYNEGDNLDEAIPYLLQLRYPIMNSSLSMMVAKITRVKLLSVGQKKTNALLHFIKKTKVKPVH